MEIIHSLRRGEQKLVFPSNMGGGGLFYMGKKTRNRGRGKRRVLTLDWIYGFLSTSAGVSSLMRGFLFVLLQLDHVTSCVLICWIFFFFYSCNILVSNNKTNSFWFKTTLAIFTGPGFWLNVEDFKKTAIGGFAATLEKRSVWPKPVCLWGIK